MKKILFIHRSVGKNLLKDGMLAELIQKEAKQANKTVEFTDINNNEEKGIPGDDTKPSDYTQFFTENSRSEDLVIIKSCYPNNSIKSDKDLEDLKEAYRQIAVNFTEHSKGKLLVLTTPPLRPIRTNAQEANRARKLANWLKQELPSSRVQVFDFYDLLATAPNQKQANTLKSIYRRLLPWDNHPTEAASRRIAPVLASVVINII